jgi:predicted glycoside hydrolase/deacetylase ChbG (UPF0249 family)
LAFIITCDDCGMDESINHVTLELHQAGMAHSASVLTNFSAAQHAFKLFAPHPTLRVGSHLNISEGMAITGVSPLTDKHGRFLPIEYLQRAWVYAPAEYLEAAEAEFVAQIEVIVKAGVHLEHITTHMHFHVIPAMRDIVLLLARRYDVRWVRAYRARDAVIPNNPFPTLRENSAHHRTLDYLAPIMYWLKQPPQEMVDTLQTLRGSIEIVVHPAKLTVPLALGVRYSAAQRSREVEYLRLVWALLNQGT